MNFTRLRGLAAGLATLIVVPMAAQTVALENGMTQLFNIADRNNTTLAAYETAIKEAALKVDVAKQERLPEVNTQLALSYLGDAHLWNRTMGDHMTAEMPHFGNTFVISASQPVYTGGAITSGIKLAELGETMARQQAESHASDVHLLVANLYLSLHSLANQCEVVKQNIVLADSLISKTRVRYGQGVVLNNDITRYELMRSTMNLQLTALQDRMDIVSHQLMTALNPNSPTSEVYTLLPSDAFDITAIPDEQHWQALAQAQNNGIKQSMTAVAMKRQEEKLVKSERLPKIAIVAENNFNGPITIEVPPIDKNLDYWYVGVGISYNISSLYKTKKKIAAATTATEHASQQQQVAREGVSDAVHAAYVNLGTACKELSTREKSMQLARQNYDVIEARYQEGLAIVTDMTDAANVRLDAELQWANSRIAVAQALYNLKWVAGDI